MRTRTAIFLGLILCGCADDSDVDPGIRSLDDLATERLRERTYGSALQIETAVEGLSHESLMASYASDGLRVYARADIPDAPAPENGYPVVVFLHGWVGADAAPELDFYYDPNSNYGQMIQAHVDAGFVVFTPGWRGHGTVAGVPADGIEYLHAWDNGSYLSPAFYAIDTLNLIDSLASFPAAKLDLDRVNLVAHSQGGDVALVTLAVAGEGSALNTAINAASIWAGTFPPRFVQLRTYHSMESTPEAFMSGDGTWTGTAESPDGSVNPNFVFGYPADWIGTVNREKWTSQEETWSKPSVLDAVQFKLEQMYGAINEFVDDVDDASYVISEADAGGLNVEHDPRVAAGMARIGAFELEQFLTEPLALHHSDRDFYSFPEWNADLCERINGAAGECYDFTYTGNTHSLHASNQEWFSPDGTVAGFSYAVQRDIALFRGDDPAGIPFP